MSTTPTLARASSTRPPRPGRPSKVAYIMSRFPKITETFILYEMLAVERQGTEVAVYPLQRERTKVVHAEAAPLVRRARFCPLISPAILAANVALLLRRPPRYLATLFRLLWANLGSLRYFGGAVAFFPKAVYFARRMQREGITHVHAHFASHPAAVAWIIHRLTGIPYSFTAHGSDLHRDQHMLREKVAAAAFVAAISEYNRRLILDVCGPGAAGTVRVVHCGVDTSIFTPVERADSADLAGPLQVLSIGTLHEVKGQTYLIDACRLLRAQNVSVECHFVGDGPDQAKLVQQAERAGLADTVHFHGRCSREAVVALLRRADVVATPSVPTRDGRREGIPVVLMEAMGSGVPVVASDLSGIPELVRHGETGLLAPPGDAAALADCLARYAADPQLRRRLGAAGRRIVLDQFDQQRCAERLCQLFHAEAER